jgi:mitogen-activated protein kinase 15
MQAYGIVWRAVDKKTRETVALKKIFDAFQNATDAQVRWCSAAAPPGAPPPLACRPTPRLTLVPPPRAQRTFREIMFLQELNNHENIIK